MGPQMRNGLARTNESQPDPPPHKLRWYQFSLRSILVVMTLFALGLGLYIKYVKQVQERHARAEYLYRVLTNARMPARWTKNPTFTKGPVINSGRDGDGVIYRGHGDMKFLLRSPTGNEPAECVESITAYLKEKNIFWNPQRVEIFENKSTLSSPEGWLKLEVKRIPNEFSHGGYQEELQLNWEYSFQPLHPPSEEQESP
jgi:hypothetical protein